MKNTISVPRVSLVMLLRLIVGRWLSKSDFESILGRARSLRAEDPWLCRVLMAVGRGTLQGHVALAAREFAEAEKAAPLGSEFEHFDVLQEDPPTPFEEKRVRFGMCSPVEFHPAVPPAHFGPTAETVACWGYFRRHQPRPTERNAEWKARRDRRAHPRNSVLVEC